MKRIIEFSLVACAFALWIAGCTNRFNQTGSWLVTSDTTVTPHFYDSDSLRAKVTTSEVNQGLANGSGLFDTVLCLGKVPWSEADMLLNFVLPDSIYNATTIMSAQVILRRTAYVLQANGSNVNAYDVHNLQFEGYAFDTSWNSATFTWDSVALLQSEGKIESANIVLTSASFVNDSDVVIQIDTGLVRRWVKATQDSNFTNDGFIIKPANTSGVVSVYSSAYSGTGYEPTIEIYCVINGVSDTVTSTTSASTYVANTSISSPSQTFAVQSGTGLHGNIVFDLSRIPNYSVVNFAQLTLYTNSSDTLYSGQSSDSLWAYYQTDPSTHALSLAGAAVSTRDSVVRNKYTFPVALIVQQMLSNQGNYGYGFMITRYDDYNSIDSRFIYNENAPDSLKPRLSIIYAPAVRKK
ncbi:MAG TPA: DNRLRE domain-containing protein [Candidatus Acidoferrales bacterium]|nr:DNRLRE domain-containing protein [Candidatus Acidoferrales bacterium]